MLCTFSRQRTLQMVRHCAILVPPIVQFSSRYLSGRSADWIPKMRKQFRTKLNGDESRHNGTGSFTLPFDTRDVWGKAKVPVKVTINGYTWRSTVGNRGGQQYIVVNAEARRKAGIKAGDLVTITLEPDTRSERSRLQYRCKRHSAQSSLKSSTRCPLRTRKNSSSGIPKPRRTKHALAESRR